MDQNILISDTIAQTYTQSEVLRRLRVLKAIMVNKLFGGKNEADREQLSEEDKLWLKNMEEKMTDKVDKKDIYKLFEGAENEIKKITPLVIYIPFDIPEHEIDKLGEKVRLDFGKTLMMELKYDPSLIAGAAFVWNGVIKDYSVRQKIAENRQIILQTFKEYVKH